MYLENFNVYIATVLSVPTPSDPATVALPAGASVEAYYAAWLRQNLHQSRGFIDGARTAYGLPLITQADWDSKMGEFEVALAALPGGAAEHALRAFREYLTLSQSTQTHNP